MSADYAEIEPMDESAIAAAEFEAAASRLYPLARFGPIYFHRATSEIPDRTEWLTEKRVREGLIAYSHGLEAIPALLAAPAGIVLVALAGCALPTEARSLLHITGPPSLPRATGSSSPQPESSPCSGSR